MRWLTEHRRKHLLEQPFPDAWRAYLEVNVAAYALLDGAERKGLRVRRDGPNSVFQESATKIDETDGVSDGTPLFESRRGRLRWAAAFSAALVEQKAGAERGEPSLLRDYAITNEAEYFAVATEVYFEQPNELRDALPDVYAAMLEFYRVDFATRVPGPPYRS